LQTGDPSFGALLKRSDVIGRQFRLRDSLHFDRARVQTANERFRDEGMSGWLTDRGEVYISVGEPDREERYDDMRTGRTVIRWTYFYGGEVIVIYFINEVSLNSYRLTFSSRAEYQRLLTRLRRAGERLGGERMPG